MHAAALFALLLCAAPQETQKRERWIYFQTNLQVDAEADRIIGLIERAAKAGYTKALLADSKLAKIGDLIKRYFTNTRRVQEAARKHGIEIVPAVFHIGYSNAMLWHDPNLAEGHPVRDALFVVRNGQARLEPDPPVALRKKWSWKDPTVTDDFVVVDPKGKLARFSQKLKVRPFRQYRVSVRVRTDTFRGQPEFKAIGGRKLLTFEDLGVKDTQDWKTHHVVFNSLDNEEVSVYFGCWNGTTGTLAWDDPKVEEVGLLNVLRRAGTPLVVKRDDDGALLVEGRDFEKVKDPGMGSTPWPGSYSSSHAPPPIRTSLPDGTRLRVSYYHSVTILGYQNMACPSEPRTVELLRDEARRVHELWGAKAYFMQHDEIRHLNWDESCRKRNLTPGQILADNVKTCVKILKETNPGGRIYVWSDMFDPHHNARKDFYLVRGDYTNSWEGLDKDVVIACWYRGKAKESMKFFADRGHKILIAGYYDAPPAEVRAWLDADKSVGRVSPVMYTTWRRNYADLEAFAEVVDAYR